MSSYLWSAPEFVAVHVSDELNAPAVFEKVHEDASVIVDGKEIVIFGVVVELFTRGLAKVNIKNRQNFITYED